MAIVQKRPTGFTDLNGNVTNVANAFDGNSSTFCEVNGGEKTTYSLTIGGAYGSLQYEWEEFTDLTSSNVTIYIDFETVYKGDDGLSLKLIHSSGSPSVSVQLALNNSVGRNTYSYTFPESGFGAGNPSSEFIRIEAEYVAQGAQGGKNDLGEIKIYDVYVQYDSATIIRPDSLPLSINLLPSLFSDGTFMPPSDPLGDGSTIQSYSFSSNYLDDVSGGLEFATSGVKQRTLSSQNSMGMLYGLGGTAYVHLYPLASNSLDNWSMSFYVELLNPLTATQIIKLSSADWQLQIYPTKFRAYTVGSSYLEYAFSGFSSGRFTITSTATSSEWYYEDTLILSFPTFRAYSWSFLSSAISPSYPLDIILDNIYILDKHITQSEVTTLVSNLTPSSFGVAIDVESILVPIVIPIHNITNNKATPNSINIDISALTPLVQWSDVSLPRGLDPFGDGSLIHSWDFVDGAVNFQRVEENGLIEMGGGSEGGLVVNPFDTNTLYYSALLTPIGALSFNLDMVGNIDFSVCLLISPITENAFFSLHIVDFDFYPFEIKKESGIWGVYGTSGYVAPLSGDLASGGLKHITIVNDTTLDEIRLYIDGILEPYTISGSMTLNSWHDFEVVKQGVDTVRVADVCVFDKALTSDELNSLKDNNYYTNIKTYPDSLFIEVANPYHREVVYDLAPFDLLTEVYIINSVGSNTYINGSFPKINMYVNEHQINGITHSALEIDLNIEMFECVKDHFTHFEAESALLTVDNLLWNYVGELNLGGTPAEPEPTVRADNISLRLSVNYVENSFNAYVLPLPLNLNITKLDENILEVVHPNSIYVPININSSVAQPVISRIVTAIGSTVLERGLFFDRVLYANDFLSTSQQTVNGDNIVYVTGLKSFTREHTISSKATVLISETTVESLISEINEDSYDIIFSDGSFLTVKNNLTAKPLNLIPLFEGSDMYYISMGVLV